jgi:hypothetical protein
MDWVFGSSRLADYFGFSAFTQPAGGRDQDQR